MDLNTVSAIARRAGRAEVGSWRPAAAVVCSIALAAWIALALSPPSTWGDDALLPEASGDRSGISANPGATNIVTGTGLLGRLLGFGKDSGLHLGGVWVGDAG